MKKFAVIALLLAAAAAIVLVCGGKGEDASSPDAYVRIHIRANSNGADDQAVKYKVRDGVVEYLAPVLSAVSSKREAIAAVRSHLAGAEQVASDILRAQGYGYGARARLAEEEFPTRVYDGATLPAGVYDALILELGSGEGDNWWCVVYPPLCFTGGSVPVVYRSKLVEIVQEFFRR